MKYFEVVKPIYIFLKITPDTSIRNYNSTSIAKAIHHLQKTIRERVKFENWKVLFEAPVKCSYLIDIFKDKVFFYLIVPKTHVDIMTIKIKDVWPRATVEICEDVKPFSHAALKYQMDFKYEDALILDTDKKSNEPLNNILNVIDVLQEDDRVSVFYNFIPINQHGWSYKFDKTMFRVKHKDPIEKEVLSIKYIAKFTLGLILELLDALIEAGQELTGGKKKDKDEGLSLLELAVSTLNLDKDLQASKKKRNETVLNTQMVILSESKSYARKYNNAITVCQAYKSIEKDNELVYRKLRDKTNIDINAFSLPIEPIKMCLSECQNLIQLPGRELLQQFKIIKKVDVTETEVPLPLRAGVSRVGTNTFKGATKEVYQTEDRELKNTAICITGPNRSGKSTLIANMVYDLIKAGRTVILPDFCGKCQLSDEIAQVVPPNKILNIKCDDFKSLQGFGYNEIVPKDNSIFEVYNCAKMKSAKLKELINLVNNGDNDLEGRMERYLEYSALIVFVCNGQVNDVFKVLKDHKLRHEYIDKIPKELKDDMGEYIEELLEIDEWSKATKDCPAEIIGTKQGHVSAILSRVHRLKGNSYIEMMLKKEGDNNINLIDEVQQGKLICIKMYDVMFATQEQKDIYVCYWITKIWGALQKRYCDLDKEKLVQTVILIDELYQTKNCEKYLTMILSQMPKYRAKLVLSCHHLDQISNIQEELKNASCSYMFIAGSNKKNFNVMKEEFENKGYTLEDFLNLKRYHALNLLAYEDGTWAGVTALPKPI